MPTFTCKDEAKGSVCIIRTCGYLDENGGQILFETAEKWFSKGFRHFIFNFNESPVINSQGIAKIIELTEIIVYEKKGALAFVGLNELTNSVFRMMGLLKIGHAYPDESSALEDLKSMS